MTAPEIPLLAACLTGGGLVAVLYLIFAKAKRNVIHCLEAVMLGIALGAAFHLMYGAIFPEHLVEVFDKTDKHLHPPEIKIKIETLHVLDILVGGAFLVFLACRGIWAIIRHQDAPPAHPHQ
jgi:hypothetical protein